LTNTNQMVKQSIYYPFKMMASRARGKALDVYVDVATYSTESTPNIPYIDVSASWDEAREQGACFIVNRHLSESITVTIDIADARSGLKAVNGEIVAGNDPKAHNTFDQPHAVVAQAFNQMTSQGQQIVVTVPPLSATAFDLVAAK
jgi:alpha-N-arabinofuranosidase